MLLGTARPASAPGRVRGRCEKRARGNGHSIPIGTNSETKLSVVKKEVSLCLDIDFEFLSRSGRFWLPPGAEKQKSERSCQKVVRPLTPMKNQRKSSVSSRSELIRMVCSRLSLGFPSTLGYLLRFLVRPPRIPQNSSDSWQNFSILLDSLRILRGSTGSSEDSERFYWIL